MAAPSTRPWLGVVADDVTGAADLAGTLVREGTPTILALGVPTGLEEAADGVDCVVVALRTRTVDPGVAVAESFASLEHLLAANVRHVYFKYCSTFDSTPRGNIGPVGEALAARLGAERVIVCPATPDNARTVYQARLFVGDRLLEQSSLRHHPLTPMTKSDLRELLAPQTALPVAAIPWQLVRRGEAALREAYRGAEPGFVVIDALDDDDLTTIGRVALGERLSSGASGLAAGIARAHGRTGARPAEVRLPSGPAAVLAGSCSERTLAQVRSYAGAAPSFRIDPRRAAAGEDVVGEAVEFARRLPAEPAPLIYSSEPAGAVAAVQRELGAARVGKVLEAALAAIAVELVVLGRRRLVIAGGETSGAVTDALGVTVLQVGPEVDPGVPWTVTTGPDPIGLVLKSGNFGGEDFFERALAS
ncbi:MAG TPA: 3-oxo-tetronate kinase [Clostridia bacterium]|nr:3-oxo-tetronate kinase [Clostridia bacterium]